MLRRTITRNAATPRRAPHAPRCCHMKDIHMHALLRNKSALVLIGALAVLMAIGILTS